MYMQAGSVILAAQIQLVANLAALRPPFPRTTQGHVSGPVPPRRGSRVSCGSLSFQPLDESARQGIALSRPSATPVPPQASFFVVYNMVTTEVIAVFENTSDELLELFENFCDLFRNATLHSEVQFPCSASSNNFARQIQRR